MGKKITKISLFTLWSALLALLLCAGLYSTVIPNTISVSTGDALPSYPCVSFAWTEREAESIPYTEVMDARLFGIVSLKKVEVKNYEGLTLIPSGRTFGVRLFGDGVCVVGVAEVDSGGKSIAPAVLAGLAPRDLLLFVNDSPIKTVNDLKTAVEASGGKPLTLRFRRGTEEKTATLTPVLDQTDGKYKSGMWVKDSATGIGTVSFIHPETGEFGALGHGVCDAESGTLLPLHRGVVTDTVVTDIVRGERGKAGEIKGYLKPGKTGVLLENTDCGVFGVLATYPRDEAIPIATAASVKTGKATVRCMLDGTAPTDYDVEITEVHGKSPNKSFTVKVTDPRLLEKTGGIIQGMSGSPIIQNGKLIGAVTHVLINDPTTGYGIFIENMLTAANMPMARAS